MEKIMLIASIPAIQTAIKVSGDGSARIQLDVPASEMAPLMKLIAFGRGKALKVTFEKDGQ
ncbi:hypothetical protein [Effusibacillus dendaii]|uniref:Uncharacterized protein n=1 Tax=Effusibacillus dendaii TaxID=2743772 RepID=A0A7I8DBY8_9BACL|nr:hypothetical protein [Effusibacillus dendaii]BCJ86489.1 hypothetical protein skT53_14740 [Effusibacillus dendaii]